MLTFYGKRMKKFATQKEIKLYCAYSECYRDCSLSSANATCGKNSILQPRPSRNVKIKIHGHVFLGVGFSLAPDRYYKVFV